MLSYTLEKTELIQVSGQVSSGFGILKSFNHSVTYKSLEQFEELEKKLNNLRESKRSTEEFLTKSFRREDELQAKEKELSQIILNNTDEKTNQVEVDMDKELSAFRLWIQEQNIERLALNNNMDAEQEEKLLAFKEKDRDKLPLNILWKLEDIVREENIVFLSDEIERQEANNELLEAYQRASNALESIKVKASQKAFEGTQVNVEDLTEKVWLETECLSKQLHGLSNSENKTWNHSKGEWVDQAFVPDIDEQLTKAPNPDYVKNLVAKYNVKISSAQTDLANQSTKVKV